MRRYAFELPNSLIYLGAFLRPTSLRPHLRAPSIVNIDFPALKQSGFNAVVIDKDNCLTIPERDELYPPLAETWRNLLSTFPGRVLVVSNSAGLHRKDPGAIAAESVALNLRAPVLVRKRSKPGCASSILAYFRGELGQPTTLRGRLDAKAEEIARAETEEEMEIIRKWEKTITGPLLGPLVDREGKEVVWNREGEKGNEDEGKDHSLGSKMRDRQYDTDEGSRPEEVRHKKENIPGTASSMSTTDKKAVTEDLRILVIGDRLFTDTLLANRLARILPRPTTETNNNDAAITPASTTPRPSVISIHTTSLPQPKDVRLLRWVEDKLTKSRVREGPIDYGRYIIPDPSQVTSAAALTAPLTWRERINPFRDTPPLTWHPRSWRPAPLLVGLGSGLWIIARYTGRGLYTFLGRAWQGEVDVAKALAERASPTQEVKKAVERVETAESVLTDKKVASPTS